MKNVFFFSPAYKTEILVIFILKYNTFSILFLFQLQKYAVKNMENNCLYIF